MPTKYLLELCKIPFQEKSLRAEKQGLYKEHNRPTTHLLTFAQLSQMLSDLWKKYNDMEIVFHFSPQFPLKTFFYYKKYLVSYNIHEETFVVFMHRISFCCLILIRVQMYQHILLKLFNIKMS
jgi:hypothetical protein